MVNLKKVNYFAIWLEIKFGYELWADKDCMYVKNLRESDLQRLNTNVFYFKEAFKSQTGFKYVFLNKITFL